MKFLCIVVAMYDLVHNLDTVLRLHYLLTAAENLVLNMHDAWKTVLKS